MQKLILSLVVLMLIGCGQSTPTEDDPTPASTTTTGILGKTQNEWVAWHNAKIQSQEGYDEFLLCDTIDMGDFPRVQLLDWNDTTQILQIQCNNYAYQSDFVFYSHDKNHPNTQPVLIELFFDQFVEGKRTSTRSLVGAELDTETQTLTTFAKARGVGGCGSSARYNWTDAMGGFFYLVEARAKDECDEDLDTPWPIIYQKEDPATPPVPEGHAPQ